jgi:cyclopropane fatty-acyl-phospholipid synthase-like methyltransferase
MDPMKISDDELERRLACERFPRSSRYPAKWVLENEMGPNALWLTEWLCEEMGLAPGMRVLDMGCGRALSSVFLAQEYGVLVWANDLWIAATENWTRVREAGVEDRVFPMHAEAHALRNLSTSMRHPVVRFTEQFLLSLMFRVG